jgi:hypothetical protein
MTNARHYFVVYGEMTELGPQWHMDEILAQKLLPAGPILTPNGNWERADDAEVIPADNKLLGDLAQRLYILDM